MTINLIACVATYKNKLAIGRDNELLFNLKNDMKFFKNITANSLSTSSLLPKNIVLMGRKTYFSIPQQHRPLTNRLNLVLTNDQYMINISPVPKNLKLTKNLYFLTLKTFKQIYKKYNPQVFVIGGAKIYNMFLNDLTLPGPHKLYITHVRTIDNKDIKFNKGSEPDTFMDNFTSKFKLIGYSERYSKNDLSYRILFYNLASTCSDEYKYLDLMQDILENGNKRDDRTCVGTISKFGTQLRFDISQSIPLLTTKKVPFKSMILELLWILHGNTDAKILQKQGVKIWDANTSREFLDKHNLQHYDEGVLGAGYGFQLRHFGSSYSQTFADTSKIDTTLIGGIDQLQYVENLLINDPYSRRIMFSYWNPSDFTKTALLPCHYSVQFYVEEINKEKYLSCHFTMRSNDVMCGLPWNISSYSALTYILAKRVGMKPKDIVYSCGDCHIYKNHVEQCKEQLSRKIYPFPQLIVNDSVKSKDWANISVDDFELIGYFSNPPIKAPMAV